MASNPAVGTRLSPVRLKAQRFWRWWSSELLGLVPQRFSAFTSTGRVPLVAMEDGALTVLEPRAADGRVDQVAIDALDAPQAVAVVRGLLERAGETRGRARLALAPGEALVRRVTMPAATEENLGAVLGFEMDRLTPFRADEVYFDHRVVSRDAAAGTLSVLLGVARRDLVEARLARARELGLSVQGVAVGDDPARSAPSLDVLPSAERGEREGPRERRVKLGLAAAALVLLVAALTVPALRKRAEVHAIKPTLDKAHTEAQATDALIRELDRLVGDYNFLLARRHASYPSLAYIEEVTRLMPDNTWLQQFEIKQAGKARELLMTGETVSSSRLIEILEQSRLIQNATPRGAVTRGTQPGTERFVIAAEIRPRAQPEAGALTDTQAAVALSPAYAPPQAPPDAGAAPRSPTAPATGTEGLIFRPGGKTYVPPDFVPPPTPPK